MKKRIIIVIIVLVALLGGLLVLKYFNKPKMVQDESALNMDDGLQKEELDNLNEDDYRKLNSPDIYNLNLDDVDSFYYYRMVETPGIYKLNATREEKELIKYYHDDFKNALFDMCKKDTDWTLIVNKDKIYSGEDDENGEYIYYNQKDGLLGDFEFNTIEKIRTDETKDKEYIYVLAKNNEVERTYRISAFIEDGEIQSVNVKFIEEKNLKTNENTNTNLILFNEDNIESNFQILCRDGEKNEETGEVYGENIAVTNNFRNKYKIFLDLFVHYSPLEYNPIKLIALDTKNHKATFEVDSILECKKRTYDVDYILTNDLYLDDAKANIAKEESYDADGSNDIFKIVYKNSCWDVIDITDKFRKKYNEKDGVFEKLEFDNAYFASGLHKDNNSYLYCLEFDTENKYYSFEIVEDEKGYIDDVIVEELNYGNVSMEEAEDLYRKQFMSN